MFARVSPDQKELVLRTLRAAGWTTLMCGDGTNDVGALKAAHVGVALLPPSEAQIKALKEREAQFRQRRQEIEARKAALRRPGARPIAIGAMPSPSPAPTQALVAGPSAKGLTAPAAPGQQLPVSHQICSLTAACRNTLTLAAMQILGNCANIRAVQSDSCCALAAFPEPSC